MKKVILLFCLMPLNAFGQLLSTFENGNIAGWEESVPGRWKADTLMALSGIFSLHHVFDNAEASTDQAGIRTAGLRPALEPVTWSFLVRHGADPSSSNCWCTFLMSDKGPSMMQPGADVNGYAVGVNVTGYDDTLRLWKIKAGTATVVRSLGVNWQSDIGTAGKALIKVTRDPSGSWDLEATCIQTAHKHISSAFEPELFAPKWFGVFYRYTSTRDRLLWLDDVSVTGYFRDPELPPELVKVKPVNRSSVYLYFDCDIDPASFTASSFYSSPSAGKALSAVLTDPSKIRIDFEKEFLNKSENTIRSAGVCSVDSACSGLVNYTFVPWKPEAGDVIISEIMADPSPPVRLPQAEFIEIYNRSDSAVNMSGWTLRWEGGKTNFPDVNINPGSFKILCSDGDTSLFNSYGGTIGISSFPALSDGGRKISVYDETGCFIHGLYYSPDFYGDRLKIDGGWSLEMIDTNFPFYTRGNWQASVSSNGGTPGRKNSVNNVNRDGYFKGIENVFPSDSVTIGLTTSESVPDLEKLASEITIDGNSISAVKMKDVISTEFELTPAIPLKRVLINKLQFNFKIKDYSGNPASVNEYRFGLAEEVAEHDIVFNELLFNPLPGDEDFIELFNNSGKILDISSIGVISVNDETFDTSGVVNISDTARCFLPGAFYVVTSGREELIARYPSAMDSNIHYTGAMPSMPDDKGHLVLLDKGLNPIDEVPYSSEWHFSLLSSVEGISLEKIRPDAPSAGRASWYSASEASGWATPGRINSAYSEKDTGDESVKLSSTRITPDNDGNEDFLVIDFSLPGKSNVITIKIFDETGTLVRRLATNVYSTGAYSATWDCTADDATIVDRGIYIILVNIIDETGRITGYKRACSVVRR